MFGNEKLKEIKIINNQVITTEGYVEQTVKLFAYEKCGHVELFYDLDKPKKNEYIFR